MKPSLKGFLLVVGATSLWGISGTIAKMLFNQQINPFHLVTIRLTLPFLVLLAYLYLRNPQLLKVKSSDLSYLAVLGIGGVALVQFTPGQYNVCRGQLTFNNKVGIIKKLSLVKHHTSNY